MKSIPQSDALLEAQLDSLQEVFSLNPEHLEEHHIERLVAEYRAHRAKFEEAERVGKRPPRLVKLPSSLASASPQTVPLRGRKAAVADLAAFFSSQTNPTSPDKENTDGTNGTDGTTGNNGSNENA
jgi:hypothetical protein